MKYLVVLSLVILGLNHGDFARADAGQDLAQEKKLSADYLVKMAQEPGAQVIEKGVVLRSIFSSAATDFPVLTDTVTVAYHLVDREGKLIEESITGDEVISFKLGQLISCWQIALPKMSVGSFYKITCPSDTAYGDKGVEQIKPGAALTFRLTLYGIQH